MRGSTVRSVFKSKPETLVPLTVFFLLIISSCIELPRINLYEKPKYPLKIISPHTGFLLIEVVDSSATLDRETPFKITSSHLEKINGMEAPIDDQVEVLGRSYHRMWVQFPTHKGYEHSVEIRTLEHDPYFPDKVEPFFLPRLDDFDFVTNDSLELILTFSDSLKDGRRIASRSGDSADTLLLFNIGVERPEEFIHELNTGGIRELRVNYDYRQSITRITFNWVDTTLNLSRGRRVIQGNHLRIKLPYRKWIYRTDVFEDSIRLTSSDGLKVTPTKKDLLTVTLETDSHGIDGSATAIHTDTLDSLWAERSDRGHLLLNLRFTRPVVNLADSAEFSDGSCLVRYRIGVTTPAPDTTAHKHKEPEIPPPPVVSFEKTGSIGKQGVREGEFNYPEGIRFDQEGFLWVCDNRNKRIQKFAIDGEVIGIIGIPQSHRFPINAPRDIALTPSGTLYIADYLGGSIKYWDAQTDSISTLIEYDTPPIQLYSPLGIFFHQFHLFVTDMKHRILELDEQGKLIREIGVSKNGKNVLSRPHGLFVDDRRRIWVADKGNGRICRFSPQGKLVRKFRNIKGVGKLREPTDVTIHEDLVFIADPGLKAVVVADTLGRKAGLLRDSLDYPFSVDVSPSLGVLAVSDRTSHRVEIFGLRIENKEDPSQ